MENKYKWLLVLPVLTLLLGAYLLLSGEALLRQAYLQQQVHHTPPNQNQTAARGGNPAGAGLQEALKSNRESAYPYFLLGAGLLVALVVLPRLGEFSFSPASGFTLKLLQEVKAAIAEVRTSAMAVEQKTMQAVRPGATETLLAPRTDLNSELSKLKADTGRLEAYASLLEKMIDKKRS